MGKPGPGPIVGLDSLDRRILSSQQFLTSVETAILDEFKTRVPLHDVAVLPPLMGAFGVYVFLPTDLELEQARQSGIFEEMERAASREILARSRGRLKEVAVSFEADSHESVQRSYKGCYDNWFRARS